MIETDSLFSLLGQALNAKPIEFFFKKYSIDLPEKRTIYNISPHMQYNFLYVDGKQQCGLIFIFQTIAWHPHYDRGISTGKKNEYFPILTTIIAHDHKNGIQKLPYDLKFGMTEEDITKLHGEFNRTHFLPPISELIEHPLFWAFFNENTIQMNAVLYKGELLNKLIFTLNVYMPIMYVNFSEFHYSQMERAVFLKWAIKNSYFRFLEPLEKYAEQLKKIDKDFDYILKDVTGIRVIYLFYLEPEIQEFALNYLSDQHSAKPIANYEEDYKSCDCSTINYYNEDEDEIKEILEKEKVLMNLISKRYQEYLAE